MRPSPLIKLHSEFTVFIIHLKLIVMLASPTNEFGDIIPPENLVQHSFDYMFNLPVCFHNVPIRIFKAQKGQFRGMWCGACYLQKADGYCKYWCEFFCRYLILNISQFWHILSLGCLTKLLESSGIQFFLYPKRNDGESLEYSTI